LARLGRRIPTPDRPSTRRDLLEELGEEAIIAQQTEAHLPQKRASVANEARSIVISQPRAPGSSAYEADPGEATVVIRERRGLSATRDPLFRSPRGALGNGSLLWAGLAVAAFAAGGLLAFLSLRGVGGAPLDLSQSKGADMTPGPSRGSTAARTEAAKAPVEETPRQVRLDELPLERPRRR
jgi:hypothetical protein